VIEGMDVVDKIGKVKTGNKGQFTTSRFKTNRREIGKGRYEIGRKSEVRSQKEKRTTENTTWLLTSYF